MDWVRANFSCESSVIIGWHIYAVAIKEMAQPVKDY